MEHARQSSSAFRWGGAVRSLRRSLRGTGIDFQHPFSVDWYNNAVEPGFRLPDFGRRSALGILIANSASLWPAFVAALKADSALFEDPHPLDRYLRDGISRAVGALSYRYDLRWEHDPPPRRIAIQRLAEAVGFARLSASNLAIHPKLGPWISLRAVVVVDVEGPRGRKPVPNTKCSDCVARCGSRLQKALAMSAELDTVSVATNWRSWLEAREACCVGAQHRFSDDQIAYHYTKDRNVLRRAAEVL